MKYCKWILEIILFIVAKARFLTYLLWQDPIIIYMLPLLQCFVFIILKFLFANIVPNSIIFLPKRNISEFINKKIIGIKIVYSSTQVLTKALSTNI
jgi:hypothetical protein